MKYLDTQIDLGAESGEDTEASIASLQASLVAVRQKRDQKEPPLSAVVDAHLAVEESLILTHLEQGEEGWNTARAAFDILFEAERWEAAVEACDALFRSQQEGALLALGQGIWLAVTFPIDPELTVAMLQHVVDETPADSDGAAVAAATAAYVTDLRATGEQREELKFFTGQMLATVARRHSNVSSQAAFEQWIEKLELDTPEKFLVRLRNVVDVLVQDGWWFDRGTIHDTLPE